MFPVILLPLFTSLLDYHLPAFSHLIDYCKNYRFLLFEDEEEYEIVDIPTIVVVLVLGGLPSNILHEHPLFEDEHEYEEEDDSVVILLLVPRRRSRSRPRQFTQQWEAIGVGPR